MSFFEKYPFSSSAHFLIRLRFCFCFVLFCHWVVWVLYTIWILSPDQIWKWEWEWKSLSLVRVFATPWLYSSWNSPGQNTGMGSLFLLQGIFPTQGLNSGLPHCRQILYQLRHKGSPRILEWVAYPSSRGSSWPRNWTGVSCIADRFFTNWAIREAPRLEINAMKIQGPATSWKCVGVL